MFKAKRCYKLEERKQAYLKQLKYAYKMSKAVWKWIRSRTKLEASYINYATDVKVYFILDRLKKEMRDHIYH